MPYSQPSNHAHNRQSSGRAIRLKRLNCPAGAWLVAAGLAVSIVTGLAGAASGQDRAEVAESMRMLTESGQPDATRLAAAQTVLRADPSRSDRRLLIRLLVEPDAEPAARRALLEAMGQTPLLHSEFEDPLRRLVAVGEESQRAAALRAMGAVGTASAAAVLVEHAAPFLPEPISEAAVGALVRMTGREDFGDDHAAWSDWLEAHRSLDRDLWQDELARGLRSRATRLSNELRRSESRTTDAYRRLFMLAPSQDRGPLLAEMLRSGPRLQVLGVELIFRELSQGRSMDPVVGVAALEMLGSPEPARRAEAARLVATLSPEGAGTRLTRALEIETSPLAAAELLAASARWPRVAAVVPALRWLDFGSATRDAAATLLLALDSEGLLTEPEHRGRTANALRAAGPHRLQDDGVRLSVRTGSDQDREAIAGLLSGGPESLRAAAASELARRPEFADRVIAAASDDPLLFAAAVAATATHRATESGYRRRGAG
ncbi:MAG: hypothetical protein AAGF47_05370 [Planctomycetota bacterium]